MPSQSSLIPRPALQTCLGVTLSAREVGYALVAGGSLYSHGVLTLRKIPSHEGRERRFCQAMARLLDAHAPTHVALVRFRVVGAEPEALLAVERDWFLREVARRGVPLTEHDADDVRSGLVPGGQRASTRALADVLAQRFPSTWRGTLDATPLPYDPRFAPATRMRTNREAYWRGMYLAAGACLLALGQRP